MDKEQLKALGESLRKTQGLIQMADSFAEGSDVDLLYQKVEELLVGANMTLVSAPSVQEKVKRLMGIISVLMTHAVIMYLKKLSRVERTLPGFKKNFMEFVEGVYDSTLTMMDKEFK